MISARPFNARDHDCWNAFNKRARNGHFLFDRNFMEYHADRFEDASIVFEEEDGDIVGLLPASLLNETVWSHQGLTFGGLIVEKAKIVDVMAMLDAASAHFKSEGLSDLVYKAIPHIYHRRPAQDDLYWLTRRGAELVRRDVSTSILFSEPGPLSSRRKRGAAKAAKAGLTFARSDNWAGFWTVLTATLEQRHAAKPVHSLEEIVRLAGLFTENVRLYTAERKGVVLAGVVMFHEQTCAHAQYIANSVEGRELGALDGLFTCLLSTSPTTATFFDFGISTEEQGRVLNEGLINQKEEFGGSSVCYDTYRMSF